MSAPSPIKAVIHSATINKDGNSWTVGLAPFGDLWLTVHKRDTIADPKPGDILTIMPPYVVAHESVPSEDQP